MACSVATVIAIANGGASASRMTEMNGQVSVALCSALGLARVPCCRSRPDAWSRPAYLSKALPTTKVKPGNSHTPPLYSATSSVSYSYHYFGNMSDSEQSPADT